MGNKRFNKLLFGSALFVAGYSLFPVIGFEISNKISTPIKDQSHLEELVSEEKTKLDCDKFIYSKLSSDEPYSHATNDGGTYSIILSEGRHSVGAMKHEVYHVCDGHLDSSSAFDTMRELLFVEEHEAVIYQLTGLRL